MRYLPGASRQEWGTSGGSWTGGPYRGVLHTTETTSWPGYKAGATAPHITVLPLPGEGIVVRQHIPFDRAARALRNLSGGVETNRRRAIQMELIGTCDPSRHGAYFWPDADQAVLDALLTEVIEPITTAFDIPLKALTFQAYPASYGARSGTNDVRMSMDDWNAYSGWCGHQHVPEQVHGDPGLFPWSRMIEGASMPTEKEYAAAVWSADRIPNPSWRADAKTNPTAQAEFALGNIWDRVGDLQTAVKALDVKVSKLPVTAAPAAPLTAAQVQAFADAVIAKLPTAPTPAAISAAVIAALQAHPLTPK